MEPAAAISIDVDALRFYRQIHGVSGGGGGEADDPIFTIGLPRFFKLLEDHGLPATLFVVGEDAGVHAEHFQPAGQLGCEIASHSHRHDYHLSRADRGAIDEELAEAEAALAPLAGGAPPVGFRAPGYNVSPTLLEVLVARGYAYDSSLLPAPLYFTARAAAIGAYALLRRPSRSLAGDVRQFCGPLTPYRAHPSAPWRPSGGPLLELPMTCEPTTRFPLVGTTWTTLPGRLRRALLQRTLRALPVINFELHAIDLLDAGDDPRLEELSRSQRDLTVPWPDKQRAFSELFRALARDRTVKTLREIAEGAPG